MNDPHQQDIASHIHPQSNLSNHERTGPMIMSHGEGIHVFDHAGNKYIDAVAGLWCASLGYSDQALIDAATRQLKKLPYFQTFASKSNEPAIELASRLLAMAPVPMSKVLFQNSGSEAIDTAMKLVWYYQNIRGKPMKKKIISRLQGYHGTSVAAASLTGLAGMHKHFDLPIAGVIHVNCPHYYRSGNEGETELEYSSRCISAIEQEIIEQGPETIAAFFAEPIMGTGGVIVPPQSYFEKLHGVLKKYDILLVADEVICGFGRTGNTWGSQTVGMVPDMITCAKALSSAYMPISALMISDEIYQKLKSGSDDVGVFGHGYTYSGHPVCAAVALETLKQYENRNLFEHIRTVAPSLQEGLREFRDHPLVGEVRGVGLMAGLELVKDKATKQSFDPVLKVGARVAAHAETQGVIVRALGDTLVFAPPFIISESQIVEVVQVIGQALDDTLQEFTGDQLKIS